MVVGGPRSLLAVPLVGRIYGVAVVHTRYARVRALYAALISADPGMMVFHKRTSCWFPWQSAIFRKARIVGTAARGFFHCYYGSRIPSTEPNRGREMSLSLSQTRGEVLYVTWRYRV